LDKYIRQIFSVFVLGMIALFSMRLLAGEWTTLNWVMMAVAGISCLLVFRSFVFIFNLSYALACIFNGAILALELPTTGSILLGGAMFLYGLRLFWFAWTRVHSDSYRLRVDNIRKEDAKLPFPIKIALWVQCTFMYTFHLFAVYIVGTLDATGPVIIVAGIAIVLGTVIEGVADQQKQLVKYGNPGAFVKDGMYARWRHPNYAGEIIVQLGLILAGVMAVSAGWANYAAVTIAPIYVILLMLSECTRSDKYQMQRYGDDESYRSYLAQSGSLLPRL
jgi:steroid 5-alpha reductase family enzyme